MRSITRRLVVIAAIAGAGALPAVAPAAPIDYDGAVRYDCRTDYSRNSVTGEDCVARTSGPLRGRAGRSASEAPGATVPAALERGTDIVCRIDYSRNSVTGEDCVVPTPAPIPDVLGAAPFPRAVADDGFSWPHAGVAGGLAVVLLGAGTAVSRRRRTRLAITRRRAAAAG
jgi:hypothetical protein